jgi:hypothetical protein
MNINEHNFMSVIPFSEFPKDFDLNIGEKADILIIGKGVLRGCVVLTDFAYSLNKDQTQIIIINLKKGKPYIKILHKN